MPRDLGPILLETAKTHGDDPFVHLFEIRLSDSAAAFLCAHDEVVVWNGNTYWPFPIEAPEVPEAADTDLSTTTITVSDLDGTIRERLRDREMIGQKCIITLVHKAHLAETDYHVRFVLTILAANASFDDNAVSFTLGPLNVLQSEVGRRMLRTRCWHRYGGPSCGYDLTRPGALPTCSRVREGANGCEAHGDDEESVGLFRLHPLRFGAFEGIPAANRA